MGNNSHQKNINLSAIIIAKNEQDRISTCVDSVSFANEIILVDNGSTDSTRQIAKQKGARVIEELKNDFSHLRNRGLLEARGKWLLYIDADEIVTKELKNEIINVTRAGDLEQSVFFIKRKNYYLGSLWPVPDRVERLFVKKNLQTWFGKVHESPKYLGTAGELKNVIIHKTHRSLTQMVKKTNEWSGIEARLLFNAGHPPVSWWRIFRVMIDNFINYYIKQYGFRAGAVGLIESMYQAFSVFVTYAKLWELQKNNPKGKLK